MWESYCTEDLRDTFPFIWYSFTYKSLNYNDILTELSSAILNICQNLVGNIMQVEPTFPKVETPPKPVSFVHLEGIAEWEAKQRVSERDVNVGDRSHIGDGFITALH